MPRNPWDLGRLGNFPPVPEEDRVLEWRQLYELGSLGRLMMRGRPQQPRSAPGGWPGGPAFGGDWYFGGMPQARPFQQFFEEPEEWGGRNAGRLRHQNDGQSLRREPRNQESGGAAGTNSASGGASVASKGGAGASAGSSGASAAGARTVGNSGTLTKGGSGLGEGFSDARQSCATTSTERTNIRQQSVSQVDNKPSSTQIFDHVIFLRLSIF
jgi:hypothetical protein